jgi:glycosyltransferase involved in cell wall biosynthesis
MRSHRIDRTLHAAPRPFPLEWEDAAPEPRVTVLIPCRNEAKNLPHVLLALPTAVHEVVLVDGHSIDGSVDVALAVRPDVVVVRQSRRGRGNALACGLAVATGEVIVVLEADGSADPTDIPRLVAALCAGADYVRASRPAGHPGTGGRTGRWGSSAAQLLFRAPCTDLAYGFAAFWAPSSGSLGLAPAAAGSRRRWGDGPEVDTVIHSRMAKGGCRVVEVPVSGGGHPAAIIAPAWRDDARVLAALLVERCTRRRAVPASPAGTALRGSA